MKVKSYCFQCLEEQAYGVIDIASKDKERKSNLREVLLFIKKNFSDEKVPAILGTEMHRLLKKITKNEDPFAGKKRESNDAAMKIETHAKKLIEKARDPLIESFKVAIAGNLIDFGVYDATVDITELRNALKDEFVIDDSKEIKKSLRKAKNVLYLCDNAGEIVFDKLCIEELKKFGLNVTAVVKSGAIVNDATLEDAYCVGLNKICKVIPSGTDIVGAVLEASSKEFQEKFNSSDLIIAKGQGHYETLDEFKDSKIIFLLKAKCKPVAEALGVAQRSSVLMLNRACSSPNP